MVFIRLRTTSICIPKSSFTAQSRVRLDPVQLRARDKAAHRRKSISDLGFTPPRVRTHPRFRRRVLCVGPRLSALGTERESTDVDSQFRFTHGLQDGSERNSNSQASIPASQSAKSLKSVRVWVQVDGRFLSKLILLNCAFALFHQGIGSSQILPWPFR